MGGVTDMWKNFIFTILVMIYVFSFFGCVSGKKEPFLNKKEAAFKELDLETNEGGIILSACGFGKTPQEAKVSALKNLSQEISVSVKTSSYLKKELNKGNASSYYKATVLLNSRTYLKGIKFSSPIFEKNSYKVCAYLTEKALNSTVNFLESTLKIDFSKLDTSQLKELLNKAYYLLGIAFLSPYKEKIRELAEKKIEKINMYLNYARLVINTIPENAEIWIDGQKYKPFSCILLPGDREYLIEVKAPGYRKRLIRVYLSKGEKITRTVELQKVFKEGIKVFVYCKDPLINEKAEEFLSNSGFKPVSSPFSPNAILIKFTDVKSQIGTYIKHDLRITIEAYKGKKLFFSVSGKMKSFYTVKEIDREVLEKKKLKLLNVVLRHFVNELNIKDFKSDKDVNYNFLINR